jgi:hypothetical protein
MKFFPSYCFLVSLTCAAGYCQAQSVDANKNGPPSTPSAIISRGANSRVWEHTDYEKAPDGKVTSVKHQYTELATGLCYQKNGKWLDSDEQINILPDGSASATHGQHQAYFPGDIYNGFIKTVTPDGLTLRSRPVGLSYYDGTNIVLIGELTNSVGQLIASNQVIYPNAFVGLNADLLYTYRKGGFEQDVVFRQQPPAPEEFGLSSASTRLQLLTEFFNAPSPRQTRSAVNPHDRLLDSTLHFGTMQMGHGRAFLNGSSASQSKVHPADVYKSWVEINGRTFLIEELPYQNISPELASLSPAGTVISSGGPILHKVSARRLLPPARLAAGVTNTIQLAKADLGQKNGLVLDYTLLNSGENNYTFQGDTVYYVSAGCLFSGTTTIEGGAIIKLDSNGLVEIAGNGTLVCQTAPYRPAIFTSFNDDSIGEPIWGTSSGSPAFGDVVQFLSFQGSQTRTLHDLRFSYCWVGVQNGDIGTINLRNCQFFNIDEAIDAVNVGLYNVLISRSSIQDMAVAAGQSCVAENVTADGGWAFLYENEGSAALTNCLITRQLFSVPGYGTIVTKDVVYLQNPSIPVYQTVGGGAYYLADNTHRGAGTTNIDPRLLADLAQKTTWPPTKYDVQDLSSFGTLGPTAPRDNSGASVDIGYHYDPVDYAIGGCDLYGNLTFTAGTAVAWFQDNGADSYLGSSYGISLNDGAYLSFNGTATQPCVFTRSSLVQEGANGAWGNADWNLGIVFMGSSLVPTVSANFTKMTSTYFQNILQDRGTQGQGFFQNCELYNNFITTWSVQNLSYTNCLLFRPCIALWNSPNYTLENCTTFNGAMVMNRDSAVNWFIENCAFDGTGFNVSDSYGVDTSNTTIDHNAYNSDNLSWLTYPQNGPYNGTPEPVGPTDVAVANYNWETSWFGKFYLPKDSPLIKAGSTTADQVGLYEFTTQTNQTPETTNIVDIGYHYVATDTNGNPLDTYVPGTPNYIVDSQGNGMDVNGLPYWWEGEYFGQVGLDPNSDPDGDGGTLLSDYQNGVDPNIIQFSIVAANNYVNSSPAPLQLNVFEGIPTFIAIVVDDTNYVADADWQAYTSPNITINLGTLQGWHNVWVGLKGGLSTNAIQTWQCKALKLDSTGPTIVVTNPVASTVNIPLIQLQGYCVKDLASMSYDINNAAGQRTGLPVSIVNRYYDTNILEFTTNSFQAFDVLLTNGVNLITLHATDQAGNMSAASVSLTVDYTGKTAPAVNLYWPTNQTQISCTNYAWRGRISDPTATVTAQMVDTNGDISTFTPVVGRDGNFWVENIPLSTSTNFLTLCVTDLVGNVTITNIMIYSNSLAVTITPPDSSVVWKQGISVNGKISDSSDYTLWVNGVKATLNGDGTWTANNVYLPSAGVAVIQARAIPNSDNGGNGTGGSGGGAVTYDNMGNPSSAGAVDAEDETDKPMRLYAESYASNEYEYRQQTEFNYDKNGDPTPDPDGFFWYIENSDAFTEINWYDGTGGFGEQIARGWGSGDNESSLGQYSTSPTPETTTYYWPPSYWPDQVVGKIHYPNGDVDSIGLPVVLEHDTLNVPLVDQTDSLSHARYFFLMPDIVSDLSITTLGRRHAQVVMKLQTGGKASWNNQSLIQINASATQFLPVADPFYHNPNIMVPEIPVPNQDIQILGKTVGNDGNLWIAEPNNASLDVTPTIAGVDDYEFSENAGRYHPYIDLDGHNLDDEIPPYCVGQQLNFAPAFDPPLPEEPQYTAQWSLDGNFVNTNIPPTNPDGCPDYYIKNPVFLQSATTHAWWTSGAYDPITYDAQLYERLTFANGQNVVLTAEGQFTMHRPKLSGFSPGSFFGAVWHKHAVGADASQLPAGTDLVTIFPTMRFGVTVSVSPQFSGSAFTTQLFNGSFGNKDCTFSTAGSEYLDVNEISKPVSVPNNPSLSFNDTPVNPCDQHTYNHEQFIDYIRFQPDGGIPVTLGTVNWNMNIDTSLQAIPGTTSEDYANFPTISDLTGGGGIFAPTGTAAITGYSLDVETFPNWPHTYHTGDCQ